MFFPTQIFCDHFCAFISRKYQETDDIRTLRCFKLNKYLSLGRKVQQI